MLILVQQDVIRRVVFDNSYGGYVGEFPAAADRTWLASDGFRVPFDLWKQQLDQKRDVFLGYCSSSAATAKVLKRFLIDDLQLSVLDWVTELRSRQQYPGADWGSCHSLQRRNIPLYLR